MLAFEIEINGKKYVTAGVDDWSILSLHVTGSRSEENPLVRDGQIKLSVGGLTIPDHDKISHHFRWEPAPLEIGSNITIRVIDSHEVDEPKKRYRSDSEIQENPFTEEQMQKMKYEDYLALKAEFEPTV